MRIDLSKIIRTSGASLDLEFEDAIPDGSSPVEGYFIFGSLHFSGSLVNVDGMISLEGSLKTLYRTSCIRCLKEVTGQLDIKILESFINDKQAAEENDAYSFEGKVLDTEKAFMDNIILSMPMKQLCNNQCRGLCSICGCNLNEAPCSCTEEVTNPQMEALKEIFKK